MSRRQRGRFAGVSEASRDEDLDLAVSSLVADSGDTQIMMRVLTDRLADALGDRLRVERDGGLFRKSATIRRIVVRFGDKELVADLAAGASSFTIGRISGDIRIRTEPTDAASWLRTLLEALQAEARESVTTRQALEAILIGGN